VNEVRVLVLRVAGSNCDHETAFAFERAGASASLVHIGELIRGERSLDEFCVLAIPGGFTYGDDLGAGKILANEMRFRLGWDLHKFVENGRLVLGICNGFQALVKAGLLPSPQDGRQLMSLTYNDSGRFECRWVHLKVNADSPCVFTRGIEGLHLPVAHGEGKVVVASGVLSSARQVLHYVDALGNRGGYPHNPNGSIDDIAGVCDDSGRVFGLMPHPERSIRNSHRPGWTAREAEESGDGLRLFVNAVEWARRL
jgi:phosphoribosylformylglycinamidine synthase I